jgi:hypothetical protein
MHNVATRITINAVYTGKFSGPGKLAFLNHNHLRTLFVWQFTGVAQGFILLYRRFLWSSEVVVVQLVSRKVSN